MAWQEMSFDKAQVNMSKVLPYDQSLSIFEKKLGYYHNNRLTAVGKISTDMAVGYRAYLRKADESHLIDGELTDYIEIFKESETGELTKIIEVSRQYYKSEVVDVLPQFEEWKPISRYTIAKSFLPKTWTKIFLSNSNVFAFTTKTNLFALRHNLSNSIYLIQTDEEKESKTLVMSNAGNLVSLPSLENSLTWVVARPDFSLITGKGANWTSTFSQQSVNVSSFNNISSNATIQGITKIIKKSDVIIDRSETDNYGCTEGEYEYSWNVNFLTYTAQAKVHIHVNATPPNYESEGLAQVEVYVNNTLTDVREIVIDTSKVDDLSNGFNSSSSNTLIYTLNESFFNVVQQPSFYARLESRQVKFFISDNAFSMQLPPLTYNNDWDNVTVGFGAYSMLNNSIGLAYNDFVINYTNGQQNTIGHRYKVICRLDNRDSRFYGADTSGVYVSQLGKKYKISLDVMFPDVEYDEEVNIIESEYCAIVGGYKVFNTTTYYNAIYNDDKVVCSCDDWNGRYYSTSTGLVDPILKSASRVGHFWNESAETPVKAISDELVEDMDLLEFSNPTYEWCNKKYTIHDDIQAVIYTAQSAQIDTMTQKWIVTKDGFEKKEDDTKIFSHGETLQIVPSILFTTFLYSSSGGYLQINSVAYQLLYYVGTATPALVIDSLNPANVQLTADDFAFVIQGSFYTIQGPQAERKIRNPFDTNVTFCADVTGLQYLGYDSEKAYFYSPASSIIYTFNGANKLSAWLEVDNRIPLKAGNIGQTKVGIDVTNIPSMNIVAMAFTDGVLVIINEQALFIPQQSVNLLEIASKNRALGMIRVNGSIYFFGENQNILQSQTTSKYLDIKTVKIGIDRLTNQTCAKHRIAIFSDKLNDLSKSQIKITITGLLGDKPFSESLIKIVTEKDLIANEFQWEFSPKTTKSNYFQVEIELENADLVGYWLDMNEQSEENLIR